MRSIQSRFEQRRFDILINDRLIKIKSALFEICSNKKYPVDSDYFRLSTICIALLGDNLAIHPVIFDVIILKNVSLKAVDFSRGHSI